MESGFEYFYGNHFKKAFLNCLDRMSEFKVMSGSRVALITSNTCRVVFIHMACAELGAIVICINAWSTTGKLLRFFRGFF